MPDRAVRQNRLARIGVSGMREDHELLKAIAENRDRAAFEELVQRHEEKAFRLALSMSGSYEAAQDILQESLLRVWKSAATFQSEKGQGHQWLMRIVARECLQYRRKH